MRSRGGSGFECRGGHGELLLLDGLKEQLWVEESLVGHDNRCALHQRRAEEIVVDPEDSKTIAVVHRRLGESNDVGLMR